MNKWKKIYYSWKAMPENERWMSSDKAKELVGVLANNGITEDELISFGDEFKKEVRDIIFKMNKTDSQKADWLMKIEEGFDSAHAAHFPGNINLTPASTLSAEDQAAMKIGYTKEYLDEVRRMPKVNLDEIRKARQSFEDSKVSDDLLKNGGQ